MSSKITILLVILAVFGICQKGLGQPWDGNGVEGEPYLIYTAEDMQAIGADPNYWDAHFKQMSNIDLGVYTGIQFNIIGINDEKAFTGNFDGDGHTISNFTYASTDAKYVGLFRYVGSGGKIKELNLLNVNQTIIQMVSMILFLVVLIFNQNQIQKSANLILGLHGILMKINQVM